MRPKLSAAEAVARAVSGIGSPDAAVSWSSDDAGPANEPPEAAARAAERADAAPGEAPPGEVSTDGGPSPGPAVRKLVPGAPPGAELPLKTLRLCGVRFRSVGPILEFDCADKSYERDEWVVVDGERGPRVGRVVIPTQRSYVLGPLRRVVRRARPDEVQAQGDSARLETEAYRFCKDRLRERRLPMKLVQVEVTSGQKAVFFFASEERVDFRDLVRDLAQRLHLRIEMRQIGARDGAKVVGGIGSCGRELCCTTFLPAFQPVSIRMAKDQGMVLNPSKLAGQCGRLKCCLVYEHQTYKEIGKGLPKVGKRVITPAGIGRVVDLDILGQKVRVILEDVGGAQTYLAAEVRPLNPPGGQQGQHAPAAPELDADSPEGEAADGEAADDGLPAVARSGAPAPARAEGPVDTAAPSPLPEH